MAGDHRARQRQAIEKTLQLLAEQYDAAMLEVALETGPARVRAEQKAAEIGQLMESLEQQIDALTLAPTHSNCPADAGPEPDKVHDFLQASLHRIDFARVEWLIRRILDSDPRGGRAGLLLFQQCRLRSGRRCAERIVSILKTEAGELFRSFAIRLRGKGDRNDVGALLHSLAGHLDLALSPQSRAEQLRQISAALCGSLQAGSIAFIEIHGCNWLVKDEPNALQWIVTDFWCRLLADLRVVAARLPSSVTLLTALLFDDELPAGAVSPEHCCSLDDLSPERLLEIELQQWTANDVSDWLARFGMRGRPPETIERICDMVMSTSQGGIPYLIEHALLEECAP
jgi:hypothetical protein